METFEHLKQKAGAFAHEIGAPDEEGTMTKGLEQLTARLPLSTWLIAAGGAMLGSLALKVAGRNTAANFMGQWVPTLLLFGIYNKIVKTLGSERSFHADAH